ncbi:hypothetical protein CEV33_3211 [Brucella grignonensis]|uniref:Uncharacterized protein n=1 Tax=Brucella grignonensis TaxID=94627 RepID=A0A256F0X3_9HYPH|nr:hypothetical protein CEV33_3211 [Brucella grignonensis]
MLSQLCCGSADLLFKCMSYCIGKLILLLSHHLNELDTGDDLAR